jgi:predicted Fe-S protein YdhL (DUF1289 family)
MLEPQVNLRAARAKHGPLGVPSPCLSVCRMDAARAVCEGCWRSIEEIAAWSRMADVDKLVVWERIEARQRDAKVLRPPTGTE